MTSHEIPAIVPYRELDDPKPPVRFPVDQRPTCLHCGSPLTELAYNTYMRTWELWAGRGLYVNVCDANPTRDHEIAEKRNGED